MPTNMASSSVSNHHGLFTPGCPCCAEELGLSGVPPAPKARSAESDRNGFMRKELTQCQYCYKSRNSGVTLFRCKGCQVELYCSKACQKAAWPSHKEKCKVNQRAHGGLGDVPAPLKDLRAFTSKHRPSLAEAGIRALDACADPSRTKKFLLVVFLRSRPDSRRIETMFYATGADVVPFDMFPQAEEMRGMLRLAHEENVRTGFMGTLNVILLCVDTGTSNVMPVGFDPHTPLEPLSMDWKSCLMKKLNEGIVS